MTRGMHYMCWFKEDWNYHPSMPSKRLQQVEDAASMKGNILLWSCLGSGAIGLPYLQKEAYEKIQPRFKFYGYLNDQEFCRECEKRGITAYAVLWKAQLWEFPAEISEEEDELLSMNKLVGEGKKVMIGMSELSTNRYPKLFEPIETFFPNGLYNSEGEKVGDYLEEFAAQTLEGKRILSSWLMVPHHDHKCYTPCANNPAYMTYMKKMLQIMVDAGAGGILLDEYDVQIHALSNGGCFCKDCMKQFRKYLKEHPCPQTEGINLEQFNYREYLLGLGYHDEDLKATQLVARQDIPLFQEFTKFNLERLEDDFRQICEYVKTYSKETRGKELPVSANLFNCLPRGEKLRKYCDTICGEKSGLKLRQDAFYKFSYSFMQGKDGSFIQDPNDHILEILDDIDHNRNDAYILFMLEPLAHGFNISISYGGWLINLKKDSFYPNLETERKMGKWLTEHENLFKMDPVAEVAVIYDHRSALEVEMFSGNYADPHKEGGFRNFFDVTQELCNHHILYNVVYVSEDEPLTAERLNGYQKLLMPDVYCLTAKEKEVVRNFAEEGDVAAIGRIDRDFFDFAFHYTKFFELEDWCRTKNPVLTAEGNKKVGLALHHASNGYNLHLLNYNLNSITREIEPIPSFAVELDKPIRSAKVHSFPAGKSTVKTDGKRLIVCDVDIDTIVEIEM